MAVAGSFSTAKGQMNFRADGGRVDIEDSVVVLVRRVGRAVPILRVEGRGQAITHAIRNLDRFIQRVCRNHRSHWTKDLFLRDAHVGSHIGEDSRLDEEAARVFAFGQMMPSASEGGAVFMLADVDIAHDFVNGFRVYHRAYFDFWIGPVADAQSFGSRYQFLREFTIDFLVHDQTRRSGAALTG